MNRITGQRNGWISGLLVRIVGGFYGNVAATVTADRTWTYPDSSVIVSGSASALTASRLVAGTATSGVVIDSLIQDGVSAGALTFTKTGTTARSWDFPDRADTVAGLAAQTFTGKQTFADQILASDGTLSLPGVAFGSQPASGWYKPATSQISLALNATQVMLCTLTGFTYSRNTTFPASPPVPIGRFISGDGITARLSREATAAQNRLMASRSEGTSAAPTALSAGIIDDFAVRGYMTTGWSAELAWLQVQATTAWTDTSNELELRRYTVAAGAVARTERERFYSDGGLQIGGAYGTSPGTGNLQIAGKLITNGSSAPAAGAFPGHIIYGSTDGSDAATGALGQLVESKISTPTNAAATATLLALTSVSIPAGDWDIEFYAEQVLNGATLTANGAVTACLGTTSASTAGTTAGYDYGQTVSPGTGTIAPPLCLGRIRVKPTTTTTYYLNVLATYTAGTPQWRGSISARRIR